jgi:hypothetical protein
MLHNKCTPRWSFKDILLVFGCPRYSSGDRCAVVNHCSSLCKPAMKEACICIFVWGSTIQLGFKEPDACQCPQAYQLHRFERDGQEQIFFMFSFHTNCSIYRGCIKPPM